MWTRSNHVSFPTHVGVNRVIVIPGQVAHAKFPHTRGGEPAMDGYAVGHPEKFPHTRGGEPIGTRLRRRRRPSFPTHVGVNRPGID